MIIHHPRCLHESIHYGRADKVEAAILEVLSDRVRDLGPRRHIRQLLAFTVDRPPVDEAPDISIERTKLFLHFEKSLRVSYSRRDLQPIPYDPLVGHELRLPRLRKSRDLCRIKPVERLAISIAFSQDRVPAQPRLRPLEYQKFKKCPVVVQRHAPLRVVILDRQIVLRPPASFHSLYRSIFATCIKQTPAALPKGGTMLVFPVKRTRSLNLISSPFLSRIFTSSGLNPLPSSLTVFAPDPCSRSTLKILSESGDSLRSKPHSIRPPRFEQYINFRGSK